MSEENLAQANEYEVTKKGRRGRSLFWPIALIAAGTGFLLANLNVLPQANWAYALSFWPLLLIFIGLDILVTQLRAPVGTFLSLVVSLSAVGVFAFLLLGGTDTTAQRTWMPQAAATRQEVPFAVPVGATETADIRLDLSNYSTTINGQPGDDLLAGSIWTTGDLVLDVQSEGSRTEVALGEESAFTWSLNPATWFSDDGTDATWQIGINETVPTDLRIAAGNGSAAADLAGLTLTGLRIDAGNGRLTGTLPAGSYEGTIDGGNGSLQLLLPSSGRQVLELDGGNGSLRLQLPAGVAARVEFDEGNGSVNVDSRFDLVDGDHDEGVYETPGYSATGDGVLIQAQTGNGSLSISQP